MEEFTDVSSVTAGREPEGLRHKVQGVVGRDDALRFRAASREAAVDLRIGRHLDAWLAVNASLPAFDERPADPRHTGVLPWRDV